jgi:hypothetical protein
VVLSEDVSRGKSLVYKPLGGDFAVGLGAKLGASVVGMRWKGCPMIAALAGRHAMPTEHLGERGTPDGVALDEACSLHFAHEGPYEPAWGWGSSGEELHQQMFDAPASAAEIVQCG